MPRGDGTGPMGMGPMTGRGAGYCAGYPVPGYMNPYGGRGGFGGGWGRGRRNWYAATGLPGWYRASVGMPAWGTPGSAPPVGAPGFAPPMGAPGFAPPVGVPVSKEQELEFLKSQAEFFENALAEIRKRLGELEKEAKK